MKTPARLTGKEKNRCWAGWFGALKLLISVAVQIRAAASFPQKTNDDPAHHVINTAAYRRIAAVSIFAFFHSPHDLHQLKKA